MDEKVTDLRGAAVHARLSSRKDFLKMAGAAGLGAAIGSNVLLRDASAAVDRSTFDIADLRFRVESRYRPFGVVSKNFVQHEDDFSERRPYLDRSLNPAPEDNSGELSVADGRLRVSDDAPFFTLFRTGKGPRAPYASVIVNVATFASSATTEQTVYAGLVKNEQNYVVAWYNNATKTVGIDAVVDGTSNRLVEEPADLEAELPVRFAFVLNGKEVTALADTGGVGGVDRRWRPLANYPNVPTAEFPDPATSPGLSAFVDLQDPDVLAHFNYGFGVRADSGAIVLDGVKAGYWGRAGVRDPHVVTWPDGTPYIKDNKLYLTLTNAGLDFFATAHWGVYTLDLDNYTSPMALEEVAKIFFKRRAFDDPGEDDGERVQVGEPKIFGDHAGHIVYDGGRNRFLIGVSTWGDFKYNGVQVNYTWTTENVLSGVHVLEARKLPLPEPLSNPAVDPSYPSTWDPHFVRIDGQWYVAYVESPSQGGANWDHHPALAKGETLGDLTLVGRDAELNQTEGMIIQKVGGKWYVLCVSGEGELGGDPGHYRIYNLKMEFVGFLNAPFTGNIPHPMITPLPHNGNTKWIMLTFDGTMYYNNFLGYGTHGDFYVLNGRPIVEGHEFRPR